MACISKGTSSIPDKIIDTSTLSLSLDNQGMATLQMIILTKDKAPITNFNYTFKFNGGTFNGFIDSDIQQRLEGSEYWEHSIVARGMMCS